MHIVNLSAKTFETMEYKLLKYIMNPAMIASWIFGIGLIHYVGSAGWLHAKITLVVIIGLSYVSWSCSKETYY